MRLYIKALCTWLTRQEGAGGSRFRRVTIELRDRVGQGKQYENGIEPREGRRGRCIPNYSSSASFDCAVLLLVLIRRGSLNKAAVWFVVCVCVCVVGGMKFVE